MSIRKQTIAGVKWTTAATVVLAIVDILKISVLARFLDKADFGLMALVTFVLGFMQLFMDLGLSSAIFHVQNISKNQYASLYWINIIFSIILFGLILAISPSIASFYNENELRILIPLMGLSILLSALGRQFKTVEQKNLNFRYLAITDFFGAFSGLAAGVYLAVEGFGVYALVYGSLLRHLISNFIYFYYGLRDLGMKLHFKFSETKPFLKIGLYKVGGQIVNYFSRDLDVLIIGKLMGAEILGGYSLAKQLVRRPMAIINPIILKVGISVFPRFQNDPRFLSKNILDLYIGMGALNAFVYGTIAILANWLVLLFYGPDYTSIVIYVQLFAAIIYLRSMGQNIGIIVITTGRTDYEFYWNIFVTLITPVVIIAAAQFSIVHIIAALGLMQFGLLFPGWFVFFKKLIRLEFLPFINSHLIPFSLALLVFVINLLFPEKTIFLNLISVILLFILLMVYSYTKLPEYKYLVKKIQLKIISTFSKTK